MKNIHIAIFCLFFANWAQAESLDIDLGTDLVRAQFNVFDRSEDLGFAGSVMVIENVGEVYSLNLRTQGMLDGQSNIRGGFGGRLFYISPQDDAIDGFQTLGLGGYIDVRVPELRNVIVGAELYFAPSVTTSGDYGNFREMMLKISYRLYQNSTVYASMRFTEVTVDNGPVDSFEIEDNPQIGFTLRF